MLYGPIIVETNINGVVTKYGWQGNWVDFSMDEGPHMSELGSWCKDTGSIIDFPDIDDFPNYNKPNKVTLYEKLNELPVFYGEWTIDEANTTATGKQYFSNVLIDLE